MTSKNFIPKIIVFCLILKAVSILAVLSMGFVTLQGRVRLGLNDIHSKSFSLDIPFETINTNFYPVHDFSLYMKWHEVFSEPLLMIYTFLFHLPSLLYIIFGIYLYRNIDNVNFLDRLTNKMLVSITIVAFLIENACLYGATFCKIEFFKKYLHLQEADWYMYDKVLSNEKFTFHFISLLVILMYAILLQKSKISTD